MMGYIVFTHDDQNPYNIIYVYVLYVYRKHNTVQNIVKY